MHNNISADDVERVTAGVDFPAKIEEIMARVEEDDPALDFFEAIQPGTTFETKEELISMVEQGDDMTIGDTGSRATDSTMSDETLAEDEELL
jgi:hypothetical protein